MKHYIKGLVEVKEGTGKFSFIASTAAVDRQGEVIDPKGWDVTAYMKNPVILWAHNYHELPVGKAVSVTGDEKELRVEGEFADDEMNPKAGQVRRLYEKGFLSAVSVGFIPKERNGNIITKAELLEISVVPVPANPEALSLMKTLGFDEAIIKSFEDAQNEPTPSEVPTDDTTTTPEPETPENGKNEPTEATPEALGEEIKEGRILSAKNAEKISKTVSIMKELTTQLEDLLTMADPAKSGESSSLNGGEHKGREPEGVVIEREILVELRKQLRLNAKQNEGGLAVLNRLLKS